VGSTGCSEESVWLAVRGGTLGESARIIPKKICSAKEVAEEKRKRRGGSAMGSSTIHRGENGPDEERMARTPGRWGGSRGKR